MSKYGGSSAPKPLKGVSIQSNYGSFDNLATNDIKLSVQTVEQLVNGITLDQVLITNSAIDNTIIGGGGANQGYFTDINSTGFATFYGTNPVNYMSWDPSTAILNISGKLNLNGCATISNISICQNTISAVNLNGSVDIVPKGIGFINLTGPILNNVASAGNFISNLSNGYVSFISSDFISLTSNRSSFSATSFSDQTFTTTNGDITFNTDTSLTTKTITFINQTDGNLQISTTVDNNVRTGDTITIVGSNSIPSVNGEYKVLNASRYSFTISTGNTFVLSTNGTTGTFLKTISNNINLNASNLVKIPTNIKLTFGTTSNSVYGNTGGIVISSANDIVYNMPGTFIIPQNVKFQYGTSGSNYINFDGTNLNISSYNNIILTGTTSNFNTIYSNFYDPNPNIGNYTSNVLDVSDRGIEFNYFTGGSMKTGWFGYKYATKKFTYLLETTNTNEVITGILGDMEVSNFSAVNINLVSNGNLDLACGTILNVNTITGCGDIVNISTGTRIALLSKGDIYIPSNIPITLGTSGTTIQEQSNGNIFITTNTNGSIIIPIQTKISFDGSSRGSQSIVSNTSGDMNINTNRNLLLNVTSGNIIIPLYTNLQLGNTSENIHGSTSGITILSKMSSVNLISNSDVNIVSSSGNLHIQSLNGDTFLLNSQGNVRLYPESRVVFGISGTSNSIRSDSIGNLIISGNNDINLTNVTTINLTATTSVNIPTDTLLNIGSENLRFIVSDTSTNLNITNLYTNGNINIYAITTRITGSNLLVNNLLTSISSNTTIISGTSSYDTNTTFTNGSAIYLNTQHVKITDPILSIANYTNFDNKDRGIEYNYFLSSSGSTNLGWFGWKNSTSNFTFYENAINNDEIITGTLGNLEIGSINVANGIIFSSRGNLDLSCGTISNINTISACSGVLNIMSSANVNINTSNMIIPYNSKIAFGDTSNSITADSIGNMMLNVQNGLGTLIINSNVQVNGTTNNVYSTITNYEDPIISIGGVTGTIINDIKDRGIEFKWNNGTTANIGFFGFKNSTQRFVFYANATNSNEIITGNIGNVEFGNGFFNNLDINNGTISNISTLIGSTSGITIVSSSGILISHQTNLFIGDTTNSISSNTSGIVLSSQLINLSSGNVNLAQNTNLNFGSTGNLIHNDTSGNLLIVSTIGNIYLNPQTSNGSNGSVIIPYGDNLVFGNFNTRINSTSNNLNLYGYDIGINSSSVTISGNVNVLGTISALQLSTVIEYYIYPVGTKQTQTITSITNTSPTSNSIIITTATDNYLTIGDTITLLNTNSVPITNGVYTVSQIDSSNIFRVSSTPITTPGTYGLMTSNLVTDPGKDIGLQFNYYTTGNNNITSGTSNYRTGFLGFLNSNKTLTFYSNALITNDIVTSGTLGNLQLNKLITNNISGFTLDGNLNCGSNTIGGTSFQIGGGTINNTPIGQTTAQPGRFTNLVSTVNSSLSNVSLQNTLNYSFERFTVSSSLPTRNPISTSVLSFISVNGATFTGSGTMGTIAINDGQLKILVVSSMGPNCEYRLQFPSGTLITPNSGNSSGNATTLTFKRRGQSCQIAWDNTLAAWILLTSGVHVS
jgi:hypothetical protein